MQATEGERKEDVLQEQRASSSLDHPKSYRRFCRGKEPEREVDGTNKICKVQPTNLRVMD